MPKLIRNCRVNAKPVGALCQAMNNWGYWEGSEEWPNNVLSVQTVVYECGMIARQGQTVVHKHEPAELKRCRRLADEVCALMGAFWEGLSSNDDSPTQPFYIVANKGDQVPSRFSEGLVRTAFGGVIYPEATIVREPLKLGTNWWADIEEQIDERDWAEDEGREQYKQKWRDVIQWFRMHPDLHAPTWIGIGTKDDAFDGMEGGANFPRLAVGITTRGSIVGTMTYVAFA